MKTVRIVGCSKEIELNEAKQRVLMYNAQIIEFVR